MVSRSNLVSAARELKRRLGTRAFLTVPRPEVTQLVRTISGEDATRVKSVMGQDLERALLEQGVRCFPSLAETSEEAVRLFHAGTVTGYVVDMLRHPSPQTDKELAASLTKLKGKWNWAPEGGGARNAPGESPEEDFRPVPIRGEPLAETVLRERR